MAAAPLPRRLILLIEHTADAIEVRCSGRLTSDTCDDFKSRVKPLLSQSPRVVLDLTALAHMDSSGLGALVSIYTSARTHSCRLQLINLSQQIRRLLGLTNLLSVFEICGSGTMKLP